MTTLAKTRPLFAQLGRIDPVLLAVGAVLLAVFVAALTIARFAFRLPSTTGPVPVKSIVAARAWRIVPRLEARAHHARGRARRARRDCTGACVRR